MKNHEEAISAYLLGEYGIENPIRCLMKESAAPWNPISTNYTQFQKFRNLRNIWLLPQSSRIFRTGDFLLGREDVEISMFKDYLSAMNIPSSKWSTYSKPLETGGLIEIKSDKLVVATYSPIDILECVESNLEANALSPVHAMITSYADIRKAPVSLSVISQEIAKNYNNPQQVINNLYATEMVTSHIGYAISIDDMWLNPDDLLKLIMRSPQILPTYKHLRDLINKYPWSTARDLVELLNVGGMNISESWLRQHLDQMVRYGLLLKEQIPGLPAPVYVVPFRGIDLINKHLLSLISVFRQSQPTKVAAQIMLNDYTKDIDELLVDVASEIGIQQEDFEKEVKNNLRWFADMRGSEIILTERKSDIKNAIKLVNGMVFTLPEDINNLETLPTLGNNIKSDLDNLLEGYIEERKHE